MNWLHNAVDYFHLKIDEDIRCCNSQWTHQQFVRAMGNFRKCDFMHVFVEGFFCIQVMNLKQRLPCYGWLYRFDFDLLILRLWSVINGWSLFVLLSVALLFFSNPWVMVTKWTTGVQTLLFIVLLLQDSFGQPLC